MKSCAAVCGSLRIYYSNYNHLKCLVRYRIDHHRFVCEGSIKRYEIARPDQTRELTYAQDFGRNAPPTH